VYVHCSRDKVTYCQDMMTNISK